MMYGDAGNDIINGGDGADTLNGGAGDDDLTGGGDGRITIRDDDGVLLSDLRDADGDYHYNDANGDTTGVGAEGSGGVFIL